ncbi:MAG TPA: dephospho-CoA kinase [Anaerolineae bacterium]
MSSERVQTRRGGKLIVGLTGNIATGKSAVMRLAADEGALAIDADKIVHELMDHDADLQAAIGVAFGSGVRRPDGRIDRKALGDIVFNDPQAMQDLEAMVHPPVREELVRRVGESDASVVFIEAIKLLESGLAEACHQIWVTRCSRQRQLERLRVCRGMETQTAVERIKAQPPPEEKVARADVVIDTDGLMKDTEAQFEMAWSRLPNPATVAPKTIPVSSPARSSSVRSQPGDGNRRDRPASVAEAQEPVARPDDLVVRRARPSDVASILLLIQKATDGAVKMKRAELLMALSERGYFIGQVGAEVSTVMGWNIDSQIGRIEEIFVHPLSAAPLTGTAVLEEIEASAADHICQVILAFLPHDVPAEVRQVFERRGFVATAKESLARNWQAAIEESQPDDTIFLIKILRDTRITT